MICEVRRVAEGNTASTREYPDHRVEVDFIKAEEWTACILEHHLPVRSMLVQQVHPFDVLVEAEQAVDMLVVIRPDVVPRQQVVRDEVVETAVDYVPVRDTPVVGTLEELREQVTESRVVVTCQLGRESIC